MSAETKSALESAIQSHISSEGRGDITTGWVLVTSSTTLRDEDGGTVWVETPNGQQRYSTLGLLESGHILHRGYVYAVMTKNHIEGEADD